MALHTEGRVYLAIDPVPGNIVTSVGEYSIRRGFELFAWFDLFLVGVTVLAERFPVAEVTHLFLLGSKKTVTNIKVG